MNNILKFQEDHKSIIVTSAIFILFLAFKTEVTEAIIICLEPIVGFGSSTPMDIFFIVLTVGLLISGVNLFYPQRKVVSEIHCAISALLVTVYLIYRIKDDYFEFAGFFNSRVAYMDVFALYLLAYIASWIIYSKDIQGPFKKKRQEATDEGKPKFTSDNPIKSIEEDIFGMSEQIHRLIDYLGQVDVTEYAFSLGLSGKWGCGKSSMFNMIKTRIKELNKDYIIVDFNPRVSKKPELIQEDFLLTLKRQLKPYHIGLNKYFTDYAASLNLSGEMPAIVGLFVGLFKAKTRDWNESFVTINSAIKEIGKRIVVFVDDLDRLTGEEIMEVMKIIGKNASFSNVVYVSSYDKMYINEALSGYLKLDKCIVFTDKYFNSEIEVPVHPNEKLMEYLKHLLIKAVESGIIRLPINTVEVVINSCKQFLNGRLLTMRDIKRFYNQFLYDFPFIQDDVQIRDFLLLSLIKYSDKVEFEKLHHFEFIEQGLLFPGSSDRLWLLKDEIASLKLRNETSVNNSLKESPKCIDILRALFPTKKSCDSWYASRSNRIFSVSSFETYFYNFEYNHLYAKDFSSLYNGTLKDACNLIDGWSDRVMDLDDYLQTRNVLYFGNKERLALFFGILQYSFYKYQMINLKSSAYSFLRVEVMKEINKKYGFADDEYELWFKGCLLKLSDINANIPGNYVNSLITTLCEDPSNEEAYLPVPLLRKFSISLFEDYLSRIESDNWSASTAFNLSKIRADETSHLIPEATTLLRESMMSRPEKYIDALMPVSEARQGAWVVTYNTSFIFKEIFKKKEAFERVIDQSSLNDLEHIVLIRKFWQLLKNNSYHPVFSEEIVENKPEAIDSWVNKQFEALDELHHLDNTINEVNAEWLKRRRLENVSEFLDKFSNIKTNLDTVSLGISYRDKLQKCVSDSIFKVSEYRDHAQDLTMDDIQIGDYVMLTHEVFDRVKYKLIYSDNIFEIHQILNGDGVRLSHFDEDVSITSLRAIPKDGINDAAIYYEPIRMATIVNQGQSAPVHHSDYTYYMDQFDTYTYEGMTFNELLAVYQPQFVHEVQHWLRKIFRRDGLKVNYSINYQFIK